MKTKQQRALNVVQQLIDWLQDEEKSERGWNDDLENIEEILRGNGFVP